MPLSQDTKMSNEQRFGGQPKFPVAQYAETNTSEYCLHYIKTHQDNLEFSQ
jgi:hypothetical protein